MLAGAKELFCFHAAAASAHLYYPPYIPNRSGSAPARILPGTYLPDRNPASQPSPPGFTRLTKCKIHTVSAFVKYQRLCPFPLDTMGCIAQNHNRHTFFSLRSAGSDRPPGSRLHRSKSSCAYSPSLIVLCFGLIIVPCPRCAFQHAGGTHSRRTAKSAGGFSGDPRKNLPCLITVNQHAFPSARSPSGQRLFVQIVEKFGTDELQHLPHPLGKLHRSFPNLPDLPSSVCCRKSPSSASRCWRTATRWKIICWTPSTTVLLSLRCRCCRAFAA